MTLYEKCQQSGDTTIHDDYMYIVQNGSGNIEIPLTGEQIKSICTQGDNDLAVEAVCNDTRVSKWLKRYSAEQIREALVEYGNWSNEELFDNEANIQRLVWTLAWDTFDSDNPNDNLATDELQTAV